MALDSYKILTRKWGNELKRKLIVKTLALLLTSVMVMETPMQSFAAEAGNIEQSADQEASVGETPSETQGESDNQSAEQTGEQNSSDEENVDGATGSNTGAQSDSGEESDQGSNTEQKNGTDGSGNSGSDGQSGADANTNAKGSDDANTSNSSDGTNGDNSTTGSSTEAQDGTSDAASNEQLSGEDSNSEEAAQDQATSEEKWFIESSRFGMTPVSGYDQVASNETVESALKTAMENHGSASISGNLTVKNVEQLIVKILENNKDDYTNISPIVTFKKDASDYVTSVTFTEKSEGTATIKGASCAENGNVTLEYSVQTGLTKVEFKRVPMDADGNYSWKDSTTVPVSKTDSKFVDTTAAPGDYAYILYGYTGEQVSICSNVITCTYTLPEVKNFKVASTDRTGTTLSWDKLDPTQGYELTRTGSDGSNVSLGEFGKDTTTYTDTKTAQNVTYTYTLTAFIKDGDAKRWTSVTKVENVQAKSSSVSKPSLSFVSPSCDQATLNWSGNAEGYELYKVNNGSYEKVTEVSGTGYQLTGLEVGQTYSYAVCPFKNGNGFRVYGEMSDTVNVTTSLSGSSIQASAAAYNRINLNWAQTTQADGYEIYRNGQLLQTVWGISNCSYTDTAIACGTTYSYQVRPFKNTNGTTSYGAFSGEVSAVTSLPGTSMQRVDSQEYQVLTVSWNQGEGATGYELYRSNTSGTGYNYLADITDGNTTSYRDTAVTVGETWFYKVKPYRVENGQKVYGPETGEVSGLVTLGSVSGVNAWASAYNRIELTWNKLSYATGYEIYYSTSPDSDYKFLKKVGKNTTKFRWSKAVCGTTYYFQVRPIQKVKKVINYGTFSNAVSAMTTIGQPSPTINKVTYDSLTLKWKAVKGAKGYNIYVADSADGSYQYYMTTKKASNVLKKLDAGRTYYFKVTAFRDNYESPLSGNVSGRPSIGNVTKLKVVSQSGTELKVTWKTVKGAEKYVILRSDSQNGNYTQIGETNKAYYVDSGLANSTTYFYKVYAVRGNCSTDQVGPVNAKTKDAGSVNTDGDKKSIYKGIDVSSYQGDINWEAVASDGIDFAMIRIVTGKNASAVNYDSKFKTNYSGARAAGLNVGVYRYSYATSRTLARKEAKAVIEALDGRKLDYPIVMDFEDSSILQSTSTNARRSEIILAFKEEIENAGYKFALYANKNWLENYIDVSMLGDTHIWIARWRSLESGHGYSGKGTVTMWQYSDSGSVKGISGKVDMDVSYKKYRN